MLLHAAGAGIKKNLKPALVVFYHTDQISLFIKLLRQYSQHLVLCSIRSDKL